MIPLNIFSIIVVVIILITIIYILINTNKKLREKMIYEKYKFLVYKKKLEEIKELKDNEQALKKINRLAKAFFEERFDFKNDMTYLELAEKFRRANKKEFKEFCELMSHKIYSGKEIDERELKKIIDTLSELIESG